MSELDLLKKKVASQEKRIKKMEGVLEEEGFLDDAEDLDVVSKPVAPVSKPGSKISFNQIISVLGVLGISIGAISFFFYGIARGWFGELLQVGIGVVAGLALFVIAYALRVKNPVWSNIVFGGSYFLEYLSVGVGVSVYGVVPAVAGIIFGFFVLASSIVLAVKFSSRAVAYFSLIGGFLIPIITDSFESQIFVLVWYALLLVALSVVSISFDWSDLRAVMLVLIAIFMFSSLGDGGSQIVEFSFFGFYFLLFNISSLANPISHNKEMGALDSVILGALPFVFLPLVYNVLEPFSNVIFGLIVILFSFIYLLEALYLKTRDLAFPTVMYSLIVAGVATFNLGVYFLFSEVLGLEFFMILFIVEWALFSYFSSLSKGEVYGVVSYLFLALIALWFVTVLKFSEGVGHATFFLVVLVMVPLISFVYLRNNINYIPSAATFIVSGYLFLFSLSKYLAFFIESLPFREIILSVMWLVYTLVLFVQVETSAGKNLAGVLLGITLLKIAFRDLLYLDGAFRIVGFIVFGVLLLIGGYFLEHAKK